MRDQSLSDVSRSEEGQPLASAYEPPQLTPLGNLNGLLATGGGSQCDFPSQAQGSGTNQGACL
jgi:hypothetical protein